MTKAICISCGARKRLPYKRCSHCGFDPAKDDASLIKSAYLSIWRYDAPDQENERRSYSEQLDRFAEIIKSGQEIEYEPEELARLSTDLEVTRSAVRSVPMAAVWGAVFRLFLPALVLGAVLLLLVAVLRLLLFLKG